MMAQDPVGGILKHLYSLRANSFGPVCALRHHANHLLLTKLSAEIL